MRVRARVRACACACVTLMGCGLQEPVAKSDTGINVCCGTG